MTPFVSALKVYFVVFELYWAFQNVKLISLCSLKVIFGLALLNSYNADLRGFGNYFQFHC